jgi:hypothetical protein
VVAPNFFDTPEVDSITCEEPIRITSAATQTRTAE